MNSERVPGNPRILVVTTITNTVFAFLLPYVGELRRNGWRVDLACRDPEGCSRVGSYFDRTFEMPWSRSIIDIAGNIAGYRRMVALLQRAEYDIVHTHTPVASFITRLASKRIPRGSRPKVVYTAHGFHFHRNGGWIRNSVFVLLERYAARYMDALVVITREDEEAAKRYKIVDANKIIYFPGIGIQRERYSRNQFASDEIAACRSGMQIPVDGRIVLMIAEFNPGKRHGDLLKAVSSLKRNDIYVVFAGVGPLVDRMTILASRLGLAANVRFLGQVNHIPLLCATAQILALPSEREGLPRAVMEAMAAEVPVVGADSRGIRDLLEDDCGLLHNVGDTIYLAMCIERLLLSRTLVSQVTQNASRKLVRYAVEPLVKSHLALYRSLLEQQVLADLSYSESRSFLGHIPISRIIVIGGLSKSLINFRGDLIRGLCERGWQVTAISSDFDAQVEQWLRDLGVVYRCISVSRADLSPMADLGYIVALRKLFKRCNPTHVLAYTHKPIVYSALALHGLPKPCARLIGMVTGLGYGFTETGRNWIRKWMVRNSVIWLYKGLGTHLNRFVFQNCDDRDLFEKMGIVGARTLNIVVRGSGVDPSTYTSAPPVTAPIRFFLISRLLPEKGVREWIQAAHVLRRQFDGIEFHLVGGRDQNPAAVSAKEVCLWQEQGIVQYHPTVADVKPFYRQCSVFVLPSYREGMPRTVLEAMASARPIITTNTPGCRETVLGPFSEIENGARVGRNGVLVPIRDVSALVTAMAYFIVNVDAIRSMGVESRSIAIELFDVKRVNREIMKFAGLS